MPTRLLTTSGLCALALVAASCQGAATEAPSETTTSTLVAASTSTASPTLLTTTTNPSSPATTRGGGGFVVDNTLQIDPAVGAPGDSLTICGLYPSTQVRVILGNDAGETWPDEIDVFVTPDDQGRWCWEGVIPTELQSNEIGTLGERRPITSGVYLIRAESFGTVFAQGTLEIVIGR